MGVLDKFEKGVERALSNTFARAFKADLKPVDIASALRVEMDDRIASLSRGRTVVPNFFVVELGPADLEKIEEWGTQQLIDDLILTATNHATDQGYVFVGPVDVSLEEVSELKAGQFKIRSSSQQAAAPSPGGSPSISTKVRDSRWNNHIPQPSRLARAASAPNPSSTSTASATSSPGRSPCSGAARKRTSSWPTRASRASTWKSGSPLTA